MTDELAWVPITERQPHDRQLVYARVKDGRPKKVTFFNRPTPRWEGSSIVYDFMYFFEWTTLDSAHKAPSPAA